MASSKRWDDEKDRNTRWYFTKEQIMNSPSRRNGIDFDKEMSNRQQAANLIQDMGQTLQVNQLCINTAIVYMHRFYMFHSFAQFHRNSIAACAIFLAAKVEEQPRKLDHVVKVAYRLTNRDQPNLETKSEVYNELANKLVTHENILLQTLGFDAVIEHPHTFVVKCCQYVRASKDLAQTSYFMATNSLHLTTMCLQYSPTVVACVCIYIVTKWFNIQIPPSNEGKHWWYYIDKGVTLETLEALTAEFLEIFNKCPARLKNRIKSGTQGVAGSPFQTVQTPAMTSQPPAMLKKPEVPTQKPQVPVDDHAAQSIVQKDRAGQQIPSHAQQRLAKPPVPAPSIHPHQRQVNGTKPAPQLAKHPTVAPPPPVAAQQNLSHVRTHGQPIPQVHQPQAPMQVKTQPVLPRSKTFAGTSMSQPMPRTEQPTMPDLHQTAPVKRPELLVKHDQRPQPRPDPTPRLSQPTTRPEHALPRRDGQPTHSQPRPEPQKPPSHVKPEPVRQDVAKRVVAVKSEPPREAPVPPPPLPKSKPPEPPQPPSVFPNHAVPSLNQNMAQSLSSGILGDFPLLEHEVMDNWDLDFGGLSPPFSALLGEKSVKTEPPKAMPSLFSPEDDNSKRTEPPPPVQTVQFQKTVEEKREIIRESVQTISAVTEVKTEVVNKKIKEVTNIEMREVKKEKPIYSTIDTKEHENLFSTLMENPATSILGIPKVEKSPEKSIFSLLKSPEKPKPPSPPPVQRAKTTSTTEPSICLKKVDQEYNSLKDGSKSVTLPSVVPEVSEHHEVKTVPLVTEQKPVEVPIKVETKVEPQKTESHEKEDKHHKKKKKKEHKKHKHKESDESRKDRKKHKKEKDRSKEKSREEETPKKLKIKMADEKPKSPEKKEVPKLKIKAPKPPSPKPEPPQELPKAPEVKISTGDGLKLKIKMNNPTPEVSRKRDRSPGVSGESSSKSRKMENGEHERKKEKKDKHKEHKSHKKDSSRDKDRESSSKHRSSESGGATL